jgi:hypothetical protein
MALPPSRGGGRGFFKCPAVLQILIEVMDECDFVFAVDALTNWL